MASFQAACRRKMYTQRSVSSSAVSNIFSICSLRTLFTCMSMEKPPSNNLLTFEEGHSKIFMPFFFWLWLGNKRVAFWKGLPVYFFCSKSRLIPCRIASPRDIPCIVQYSCNLAAVSWSSRIVRLIPFGLSALGRPVRGDISSPHFLPCIKYILCKAKSQVEFSLFFIASY